MEQAQKNELLKQLKFNIREESSPFFTDDEELLYLLEKNAYDLDKTSYSALLRKAEDDSITLPSGLSVPNNQKYWLRLASQFRKNQSGCIKRSDDVWP